MFEAVGAESEAGAEDPTSRTSACFESAVLWGFTFGIETSQLLDQQLASSSATGPISYVLYLFAGLGGRSQLPKLAC